MADNVAVTPGSGKTVLADEVTDGTLGTGVVQMIKIMDGTLDGTTKAAVSAAGLAVDISGAALKAGTNIVGKFGIDQTTDGTTNAVHLVAGTAIAGKVGIDQTTDGTTNKVAANIRHSDGTVITDATGIKVSTSQLAALATAYDVLNNAGGGQKVYLPTDQAVLTTQLAASSNIVSGAITSAMTGTTSTSLVAAPGANLHNYITTLIVSNSHATVGTDVVIQDGSGGTTLLTIPAAAVYGGAVITLPTPLRQPTANTALFCANVTTGASTKVSAVGFKAA